MKSSTRFPLLAAALLASACTIDSYDKGESDYSLVTADFVVATINAEKQVSQVETDQGDRLSPQEPLTAKWIETADTTYRAMLYYKVAAAGTFQAVSMGRVGVLKPTSPERLKGGMKADALHVESIWPSKNGKWLNMRLRLLTGQSDNEDARQSLALVADSIVTTADGRTKAMMQLWHDQGGQPEYYSAVTYASIPLDSIKADSVTITVNTYEGLMSRTFAVR